MSERPVVWGGRGVAAVALLLAGALAGTPAAVSGRQAPVPALDARWPVGPAPRIVVLGPRLPARSGADLEPLGTGPDGSVPTRVTAVAGPAYAAGAVHRWILGPHYRDVWTTPVQVELLDLAGTAGGLTPTGTGGGMQTRSLRFEGADGREYAFRSIDKDPTALVPAVLRGTVVHDIVQDGISAAHPYGALVAAPLLRAAGVLHAEPLLRVMPSDPALGEYRDAFAGMLGILEERPDENGGHGRAFAGADKVIGSDRLVARLDEGPDDRVDARAYLKARLLDVFLGDFDRHRGQWRWASFEEKGPRRWQPVPRDRDQVFADFDGVATTIAGVYVPQFVRFGPEYPDLTRLHWNARDIDRWFLAELDAGAWDAVGASVRAALTDEVIADAVGHLPPEIHALHGDALEETLRRRRDGLPEAWRALYALMSGQVDVRATDAAELVVVDRGREGEVTIVVSGRASPDRPYFERRFVAGETREVRIALRDGDDQVVVTGEAGSGITIRLVGGEGDDEFRFDGAPDGVHLYDHQGANAAVGDAAPSIDARPYEAWEWSEEDRNQPRDWGSRSTPLFWSSYSSDVGAFVGGGFAHERYGFRHEEFASRLEVRAGLSPRLAKARIQMDGRVNRAGSPLFVAARLRVSGLDVLHYYGMGNATAPGDEAHHRVDVSRLSAEAGPGLFLGAGARLALLGRIERTHTRGAATGFLAGQDGLYGDDVFVSLGLGARLTLDPGAADPAGGSRIRATLESVVHPRAADVEQAYGRTSVRVSAIVAQGPDAPVTLALRGGAERVLGRAPWHQAAFLGGEATVRGWDEQRFAGDGSLFGGAEFRVRLLRPRVVVPAEAGVFGFADTGRVFVGGRSEGGWHTGVGGGVFVRPVGQPFLARLGVAASPEATKLFLNMGLPY